MTTRLIRTTVALIAMFIASRFPDSTLANVVKYTALGYLTLDIVLMARAGYLRRRPYWTAESWRRYLAASAIRARRPARRHRHGGAVDLQARGRRRFRLAAARRVDWSQCWSVVLVGAWGLTNAISWLTEGDPAQPFTRSPRRRRPAPSIRLAPVYASRRRCPTIGRLGFDHQAGVASIVGLRQRAAHGARGSTELMARVERALDEPPAQNA